MILTKREIEVLTLTALECLSAKEIAYRLCISVVTVQNHIHNIKLKKKLSKITELSRLYFVEYAGNIGAVALLLIFSIQLFNYDSSDMRVNRCRRSGRRFETEFVEEFDYDCD